MTSTTMTSTTITHRVSTFGRPQIAICVLAAATAVVHLYLGAVTSALLVNDPGLVAELGGTTMMTIMAGLFYLSGIGYLGLTAALYLPKLHRYQRLARWGLITWAAGNVVAYAVMMYANLDAFGLLDKAGELLLIALLVLEGRRARAHA